MQLVAGIDVSKASLEVAVDGGPGRRFANTAAGCRAVGRWLRGQGVTVAVCEPPGGYERALVDRLQEEELAVVRAHPPRVRAYARACGAEAKTDGVDAQVLAGYGATLGPAPLPPTDPGRRDLPDVLRRRDHLVRQRVQEENRQDHARAAAAAQSLRRHVTWLEREIARLDAAYPAILARHPALARRAALYRSVRGIGALTAAILTAELPELGQVGGARPDRVGGPGAVGAGQRAPAGLSRDPGRAARGAPGLVPGGHGGDPPAGRPAAVLRASAAAREAGQGGPGGGDAQAAAASARRGPPGHALDRGVCARRLKCLDRQHRYSGERRNPGRVHLELRRMHG